MKLSNALLLLVSFTASTAAQDKIPGFDIYLADLSDHPGAPVNITARPGYDNQPAFSADGSQVFYTRMEDDGQTEIWKYDLSSGNHERLTTTAESEYSPTPIPGASALSMVRVEADQKQRLWQLNLDNGIHKLLLPKIEPVGYHAWLGPGSIALFLLPEPFTLMISGLNGSTSIVADHIGRSLHLNPATGALLYVDQSEIPWRIISLDTTSGERQPLADLLPAQEDFAVSSAGTLWSAMDSKLFKKTAAGDAWELVADFTEFGITGISRIAISADEKTAALVAAEWQQTD